jgi:hypothetical protein
MFRHRRRTKALALAECPTRALGHLAFSSVVECLRLFGARVPNRHFPRRSAPCDALSGLMWPSRPDTDPVPCKRLEKLYSPALLKSLSTLTSAESFEDFK